MKLMGKKLPKNTLTCPCCGRDRAVDAVECDGCGARQVGPPLAKPDVVLPKLGPALSALAIAVLVVLVYLAVWVFSNDSKVGRVLMVSVLGEGTKFTRSLLAADPRLPLYRIFSYDAIRYAFYLSLGLIPLSLAGIWLARRARRLATSDPASYGGAKMARASMVLSSLWLMLLTTAVALNVPGAIERSKIRRRAATRAAMYNLHQQAIQKYFNEFGSYPEELTQLSRVNIDGGPWLDYWDQPFLYRPDVEMASGGNSVSLANYRLVSAGADGRYGTSDDLIMVDGLILDAPVEDDMPVSVKGRNQAGEQ